MDIVRDAADRPEAVAFEVFAQDAEERLRLALVARYGPELGRMAALDALSWAWEHWSRLQTMSNPVGYLYRVGQTAARRAAPRPIPIDPAGFTELPGVEPGLPAAIAALSERQRSAVLLVHALGFTVRQAAEMLDVGPSTIQIHLERGMARLRSLLEVSDVH